MALPKVRSIPEVDPPDDCEVCSRDRPRHTGPHTPTIQTSPKPEKWDRVPWAADVQSEAWLSRWSTRLLGVCVGVFRGRPRLHWGLMTLLTLQRSGPSTLRGKGRHTYNLSGHVLRADRYLNVHLQT